MDYVAVGFLGVLLGAGAAAGTALLLLHRMVDRDLMERRLRALVSLREAMGAPRAPGRSPELFLDPLELEQAVHDFEAAVRELRLTAWMFDERLRADLARPVRDFEEELRVSRECGRPPSSF